MHERRDWEPLTTDEDRGVGHIVHRGVVEVQPIISLAARHELAVGAMTPVSNGNATQEHPLHTFTVWGRVNGGAGVGSVASEVDTFSVRHGVLASKGAVEALRLNLGHCGSGGSSHQCVSMPDRPSS